MESRRLGQAIASELMLVLLLFGINMWVAPTNPAFLPMWALFPSEVWGFFFVGTATLGYTALYLGSYRLWRISLTSAVFLLASISFLLTQSHAWTGVTTYGCLAYSAFLRLLGIPTAGFIRVNRSCKI